MPNSRWKKSKPCLVTSRMSSASRYCFIDWRQNTDMSIPSCESRTTWYGPAHTAVMYELIRGERWHPEGELGLEVGLVEAGVNALGVGGLELAVEVHLLVDRVDAAVHALPGRGVRAVGVDDEHVLGGQPAEGEAVLGAPPARVDRRAVERGAAQRLGGDLDEGVRTGFPAGEPHFGDRVEGSLARVTGAIGQIEVDVVCRHVEPARALDRHDLAQVAYSGHVFLTSWCCVPSPRTAPC